MFAASVCCLCVASSFLLQLSVLLRVVLWLGVFTHAASALNIAIFEESSARLLSQPVMETSTCGTAEGTSSGNPSSSMNPETKRKGSAEAFERSEKRLRSTLNQVTLQPLSIMTVNMQFEPSFLTDPHKGKQSLQKRIGQTQLPDIICIQEGMPDMDVWQNLKYKLVICAGTQGVAQSDDVPQARSFKVLQEGSVAQTPLQPSVPPERFSMGSKGLRSRADFKRLRACWWGRPKDSTVGSTLDVLAHARQDRLSKDGCVRHVHAPLGGTL